MSADLSKVMLCAIRTFGTVLLVGLLIWGAKALGVSYDDLRIFLVLFYEYVPLFITLGIFGAAAFVFYRATKDEENEFEFVRFFIANSNHDIWRFGYFMLLLASVSAIFVLLWRNSLDAGFIGVVLGAFILKNGVDSIGRAFGNKGPDGKTEGQ